MHHAHQVGSGYASKLNCLMFQVPHITILCFYTVTLIKLAFLRPSLGGLLGDISAALGVLLPFL